VCVCVCVRACACVQVRVSVFVHACVCVLWHVAMLVTLAYCANDDSGTQQETKVIAAVTAGCELIDASVWYLDRRCVRSHPPGTFVALKKDLGYTYKLLRLLESDYAMLRN